MEAISVSLDVKGFYQLLSGLCQILLNDSEGNNSLYDQLQQKVYRNTSLDPPEARAEMTIFDSILRKAAQENWSADELQQFLLSKSFPTDYVNVLLKLWAKESQQIHSHLLNNVTLQDTLEKINWRVDMQALSRNADDLNEPIAYFELDVKNTTTNAVDAGPVKLKLSREEAGSMLAKLNDIQRVIDELGAEKR